MRYTFLTLIFLFSLQSYAQQDTVERTGKFKCKILQHELEIDPISVWYNKGISLGHRVKHTYLFSAYEKISLDVNGTVLSQLDTRLVPKENVGVFPRLNQSQVYFERMYPFFRTKDKERKSGLSSFGYRLGYHYFQHASDWRENEYWAVDSLEQTGLRTIAGFYSHSLLGGIAYNHRKIIIRRKSKKTKRSGVGERNHRVSLDYIFSPYYQLKLYDVEGELNTNEEKVKSFLPLNRSGVQFQYRFAYLSSRRFGMHADFEALLAPFLENYQPNYDFFVPRGGERIVPLFLNVRVGFYWLF